MACSNRRLAVVAALVLMAVIPCLCYGAALEVSWVPNGESDLAGYEIYYHRASEGYGSPVVVGKYTPVEEDGRLHYTLNNLYPDETYYVKMLAYDISGNKSGYSAEDSATTSSDDDGDPGGSVSPTSSSGGGGGCFIATAAYGSYGAGQVRCLRWFRDRVLLASSPGRAFVARYYDYSPALAGYIAPRPWLRGALQLVLYPLVWLAALWRASVAGPLLLLAGLLALGLMPVRARRPVQP